jgi:pimeloyl-ACP methyl ester carboxylesterase
MKTINVNGIILCRGTEASFADSRFPLDHTRGIKFLLENEFDVLPDLRGFGESTTVESQYTMTDMADDLRSVGSFEIENCLQVTQWVGMWPWRLPGNIHSV